MATENRWRAPRIAREIGRLGIDIHPDTVRRHMPKLPPTDEQRQSWRQFLLNHRDAMGVTPVKTACRSPWQNGVAKRWIGSIRRELLDHVILLGEDHLRRLGRSYVSYCNEDRCHMTLEGDSPAGRPVQPRPSADAKVIGLPRAAGLHHRYEWRRAA